MPDTFTWSWSGQKLEPVIRPDLAVSIAIALAPADSGLTVQYARGTLLGRQTDTGLYGIYDSQASDGTEVAVGLLMYDASVDDTGLMAMTTSTVATNEFGLQQQNIGMYVSGYFLGTDLVQSGAGAVDTNALTDLAGRFINGDLTNGIFRF